MTKAGLSKPGLSVFRSPAARVEPASPDLESGVIPLDQAGVCGDGMIPADYVYPSMYAATIPPISKTRRMIPAITVGSIVSPFLPTVGRNSLKTRLKLVS